MKISAMCNDTPVALAPIHVITFQLIHFSQFFTNADMSMSMLCLVCVPVLRRVTPIL
jgi:hypothetical protein